MQSDVVSWAAVWVGGGSTRMGGSPKGLLLAPDGVPIVQRTLDLLRVALPGAQLVLAGVQPAYAHLGVEQVPDQPAGEGPIGGLCAVLERAHAAGAGQLLAVSCDLPYLNLELLQRLMAYAPEAWVVAPKAGPDKWQPLFARYRVDSSLSATRAVIARGDRSLQRVVAALAPGCVELPLDSSQAPLLRDWDSPEDVERGPTK